MMTGDLVKRLREPISQMPGTDDEWIARVVEERARAADRIEALEKALRGLLECPAIADGCHREAAWACAETAAAEDEAIRALKEGEDV